MVKQEHCQLYNELAKRIHIPTQIHGKYWKGRGASIMTKQNLIQLCKNDGLYINKRHKKEDIVNMYTINHHIKRIQSSWRKRHYHTNWTNSTCPITLEDLSNIKHVFVRTNQLKYRRGFNLTELAKYMVSSGYIIDPIDKESLSVGDLRQIDRVCKKNNIKLEHKVEDILLPIRQDMYIRTRNIESDFEVVSGSIIQSIPNMWNSLLCTELDTLEQITDIYAFHMFQTNCELISRMSTDADLFDDVQSVCLTEINLLPDIEQQQVALYLIKQFVNVIFDSTRCNYTHLQLDYSGYSDTETLDSDQSDDDEPSSDEENTLQPEIIDTEEKKEIYMETLELIFSESTTFIANINRTMESNRSFRFIPRSRITNAFI
jgi:hypothetical protein